MADSKNKALPAGTVLRGAVYTYTIEKVLGQGSFGITYLASTLIKGPLGELSMPVAVKEFFAKDLDSRGEGGTVTARTEDGVAYRYAKAFQRESQNLSKLKHPGIVKVLEAFQANGTYYYSMEYLSGGSLDDKVKGLGIPEEEALPMIKKIGEALSFMHQHKMMHLDLKPKNIMLKADGTPVIIDFGLSKQYDDSGEPESSTTIGLGTPGYAPIEQATQTTSGEFQPTLDIYALGATLFKMLTGKTPPAATLVLNKKATLTPDLQAKNVSSGTIDAIRKAMAPLMDDRPQRVEDFCFLLEPEPKKTVGDSSFVGLKAGMTLRNGKYQILEIIGMSSLVITYLARCSDSRKKVIVKEFFNVNRSTRLIETGDVLYDDGVVCRIFDEEALLKESGYKEFVNVAKMLEQLKHKGIVRILDFFTEKGTAYYVTDYLAQGSLEDKVRTGGPLTESDAERLVRQVADALKLIHARKEILFHVDPAHIFLNAKGDAVLVGPILDIAFPEDLLEDLPAPRPTPYQGLESRLNDPSKINLVSDIYSLGATLYFLLTGTPPPLALDSFEYGLERPIEISDRMWRVIEESMRPAPTKRPQKIDVFLSLFDEDDETQKASVKGPSPKAKKASPKHRKTTPVSDVSPSPYEQTVIEKIASSTSKSMLKSVLPQCTTNELRNIWYDYAISHGFYTHNQASKLLSSMPIDPSDKIVDLKEEGNGTTVWKIILWVIAFVLFLIRIIMYSL